METLKQAILADLNQRDTGLQKPHRTGLANIVSAILVCKSPNLMLLGSVLERDIKDPEKRYQYISRVLSNPMINIKDTMKSYVQELGEKVASSGESLIVIMDQTKAGKEMECLMVSLRVGNRALPLLWSVKETKGNIGFKDQEQLLDSVASMLPKQSKVILMADRFYGTSSLVNWCQNHQWSYRVRLKSNLYFNDQKGLLITGECFKNGVTQIENVTFNNTDVKTNIGIIFEKEHPEAWIIAMDCKPNEYTALDYGLRWGIEAMFSDYKSKGFNILETKLTHTDRLERLILAMSIALYWAVSTGMFVDKVSEKNVKKNGSDQCFHFLLKDFALS